MRAWRIAAVVVAGAMIMAQGLSSADPRAATVTAGRPGSHPAPQAGTAVLTSRKVVIEDHFRKYVIDAQPPGAVVEKTLADILGNGKLDAVIGTEVSPYLPGSRDGIYWYQYPASGPGGHWIRHTILAHGYAYEAMAAYDVNRDGKVDIVASVDSNLYWFKNPGTTTGVWQQTLIGPGYGEDTIVLGDVDGDGQMDVASNTGIYFQNNPYSWTRRQLSNSFRGAALLNIGSGKGRIDLVGNEDHAPWNIVWYENPRETGGNARSGTWKVHTVGPGYHCTLGVSQCPNGAAATMATAVLSGSGRMDIVVGQSEGSPPPAGGLKWFAPSANRTLPWTERTIDATLTNTHDIKIGHINGDRFPDIMIGQQDQTVQKRVMVLYNNGKGTFTEQVLSHDATHNVALGDINGNGRLSILAGPHGYYGGSHPLETYINRG